MRGQRLVVDTSVIIKWYRQDEVDAEAALAVRSAYLTGDVQLVGPDLALTEFANVMRYMKDLSTEQVQQAVDSLFAMRLTWLTPTGAVLKRAVAIAREYETPVYDALFAAVAEELSALYVTADERFVKRVPELGYVRSLAGFRLP
jgi:predicted nucleic acid-binding protein